MVEESGRGLDGIECGVDTGEKGIEGKDSMSCLNGANSKIGAHITRVLHWGLD